ncbi:MAG TPA: dCTP deaminase [Lacunisphaera sp.]|nr:dCTP deaminase [Lacunisphaera sp.]
MILTGRAIEARVRSGEIKIEPFRAEQLNPASYDLRLGLNVWVYDAVVRVARHNMPPKHLPRVLDAREENPGTTTTIGSRGVIVNPGYVYLMHTEEVVCSENLVSVVDGKSSIGRLGVTVHVTAGYIDPGFKGQITLEVATLGQPVRLYAGMLIAQLRFHELIGEVTSYQERGNYTGEASMGPVPSKSWRQFG